ncbi:hypothetical protein PQX77_018104 [Marasmius sp. AFHP31]|nr:hypothetical protein PQX77_018104 [Marasmius sp. AFHP31]
MTIKKSSLAGSYPTNLPLAISPLTSQARARAPVGALILSCVAILENGEVEPGSTKSMVFDARVDLPDDMTVATGKVHAWIDGALPTTPVVAECAIAAFDPNTALPAYVTYQHDKDCPKALDARTIEATAILSIPEVPVPIDVPLLHIAGFTERMVQNSSFDVKTHQWVKIVKGFGSAIVHVQFFENDRFGQRKPIPLNGSIVFVLGKLLRIDFANNVHSFWVEPVQLTVLLRASGNQALSGNIGFGGGGGGGGGGGPSGGGGGCGGSPSGSGSGGEGGPSLGGFNGGFGSGSPSFSASNNAFSSRNSNIGNTEPSTPTPAQKSSASFSPLVNEHRPQGSFLEDWPEVRPELLKRKNPDDPSVDSPTPASSTCSTGHGRSRGRGSSTNNTTSSASTASGRGRGRGRGRGHGGATASKATRVTKNKGGSTSTLSAKAQGKQRASDDFYIVSSGPPSPLTDIEMDGTNNDILDNENRPLLVEDEAEEDNELCEDDD